MVYLHGALGAGKTTLAQGFIRAGGVAGPVRSPTYTLVQAYGSGAAAVVHLDLYRLRSADETEHLGLADWAVPGAVWLVEWPERAAGALPPADVRVALSFASDAHVAELSADSAAGFAWLERLSREPGERPA